MESPQIVDMTPGVQPNLLFWTGRLPRGSFSFRGDGTRARLNLRGYPLVDTISFGNTANALNAIADISVEWKATGPAHARGLGGGEPESSAGRFEAMFADADCTARASAHRTGFSLRTRELTSEGFYASLGKEKNGSFI